MWYWARSIGSGILGLGHWVCVSNLAMGVDGCGGFANWLMGDRVTYLYAL